MDIGAGPLAPADGDPTDSRRQIVDPISTVDNHRRATEQRRVDRTVFIVISLHDRAAWRISAWHVGDEPKGTELVVGVERVVHDGPRAPRLEFGD